MTDADLDKLEALAKAAQAERGGSGHWHQPGDQNPPTNSFDVTEYLCYFEDEGRPRFWDWTTIGAYICAANPATILDLIASARRDAEEIERLRGALRAERAKSRNKTMRVKLPARAAHTGEG